MKGIVDFIIHIPQPFSEKFKTENGSEFYGDKRILAERLSNRIGTIINTPLAIDTDLKPGYEVLVDPSILYEQNFDLTHGNQESMYLVDKEKMYFKINPRMIVLYRESETDQWKGYMENGLFEKVPVEKEEKPLKSNLIIIPEIEHKKFQDGKARVVYGNNMLDAANGDIVLVQESFGIEFFLDGKSYWWYRNEDVLAKVL